jgi:hypothetical protein
MTSLLELNGVCATGSARGARRTIRQPFLGSGCFEDDLAILIDWEAQGRPKDQDQSASGYFGELWPMSWNRGWDM